MLKSQLQGWVSAARPRTLPLALSGIILGNMLAYFDKQWSVDIAIWSVVTAVCLQILSNFANDYGDTQNGADSHLRLGPTRAVQSGIISSQSMLKAILLTGFISLLSGIMLIYMAFGWFTVYFNVFLVIGLFALLAAYAYTAGAMPYGYKGFGDVSVGVFFGPVAVFGSYFLHTQSWKYINLLPAVGIGLLAIAVLNLNNMRDVVSDRAAGKNTIPVRIGLKLAGYYHLVLIVTSLLLFSIFHFIEIGASNWMFFLLPYILLGKTLQIVLGNPKPELLDPLLKKSALSTLAIVLLFGVHLIF